jgi:NTE family protein
MENFDSIINYIKGVNSDAMQKDQEGQQLVDKLIALKNADKTYSEIHSKNEKKEKFQYVNLVQEGGGTLGIALVGFTFVLEYLGIRFLRLAGTSAGAINTLFMAAMPTTKEEAITPRLFQIIREMKMMDFVDGHPIAKSLIKSVVAKDGWVNTLVITFSVLLLLLVFVFPFLYYFSSDVGIFYLLTFIAFITMLGFVVYLLLRFARARYGVNPGEKFVDFLKKNLQNYHITTKSDLDQRATFNTCIDGAKSGIDFNNQVNEQVNIQLITELAAAKNWPLNLINQHIALDQAYPINCIKADYTFVTADIGAQHKVEFPKNANLYFSNPDDVNPADFIRASMAIPLFFEPKIIDIDKDDQKIINAWNAIHVSSNNIPSKGVFIDGGSISNFPINIFHDPHRIAPRLPVIGVRLNDAKPESNIEIRNVGDYAGRIINTMRGHFDKQFLTMFSFYKKFSIAEINAYETKANWLDFNMSEENKRALFLKGVESAINYLSNFNWDEYKRGRIEMYLEINRPN